MVWNSVAQPFMEQETWAKFRLHSGKIKYIPQNAESISTITCSPHNTNQKDAQFSINLFHW